MTDETHDYASELLSARPNTGLVTLRELAAESRDPAERALWDSILSDFAAGEQGATAMGELVENSMWGGVWKSLLRDIVRAKAYEMKSTADLRAALDAAVGSNNTKH